MGSSGTESGWAPRQVRGAAAEGRVDRTEGKINKWEKRKFTRSIRKGVGVIELQLPNAFLPPLLNEGETLANLLSF